MNRIQAAPAPCLVRVRLPRLTVAIGRNHTYDYSYDLTDNRLSSSESGALTSYVHDAAGRLVTSVAGTAVVTYNYDVNGNLTGVDPGGSNWKTTMAYDKENRLTSYSEKVGAGLSASTYSYDGDGLKRTEFKGTTLTTLVWDGDEYLGEI